MNYIKKINWSEDVFSKIYLNLIHKSTQIPMLNTTAL